MQPCIHLFQLRSVQIRKFIDKFFGTHIGTVAQTGVPDKRKRLTAIAACPIPVMRERLTVQRASRAQNQILPGEILKAETISKLRGSRGDEAQINGKLEPPYVGCYS